MRRFGTMLALTGLTLATPAAPDSGFAPLYNGRDFTGWHVYRGELAAWQAKPAMISVAGKNGGCLLTDREYGEFELRLEYRIAAGGNAGLGIRVPPGGWPSTDGFEIQILDDETPANAALPPEDRHGSIYKHAAPTARPFRAAGEWNRMVVRCQGDWVVVQVNGVEIHSLNLNDYHDSQGKGMVGLGQRPRRGQIGIPSHGDPADFRNLEIKALQ